MGALVDLHVHSSKSSDGEYSPSEIIALARSADLRAIAIADHDTVAAYPEALEAGEAEGMEVIPSMEVTTVYDEREFHLLLPFLSWESTVVADLEKEVSRRRFQEAAERVEKLKMLGFDITWEEILSATAPLAPLGVTIAQVLLQKTDRPANKDLKKYLNGKEKLFAPYHFYKDFFMEGMPACVPRRNIQLTDVLKIAPATGGVPVLAHPGAYFQNTTREDIGVLKERGVRGLEVYTSYHNAEKTRFFKEIAEEFGLIATAGSDFHGAVKPHVKLGGLEHGEYEMVEALRKWRSQ